MSHLVEAVRQLRGIAGRRQVEAARVGSSPAGAILVMGPLHGAFANTPFTLATVQLPEGPRILAQFQDIAPAAVRIGMSVQVDFAPVSSELAYAIFRAAPA